MTPTDLDLRFAASGGDSWRLSAWTVADPLSSGLDDDRPESPHGHPGGATAAMSDGLDSGLAATDREQGAGPAAERPLIDAELAEAVFAAGTSAPDATIFARADVGTALLPAYRFPDALSGWQSLAQRQDLIPAAAGSIRTGAPGPAAGDAAATSSLLRAEGLRVDPSMIAGKLAGASGLHLDGPGLRAASAGDGLLHIEASSRSGDGASLLHSLEVLGLQAGTAYGATVSGHLPAAALEGLAGIADLGIVRDSAALSLAGSVSNQADTALRADTARGTYGVDGTGVRIGVLSDSYNRLGGAGQDIATGDLPADGVTVLDEYGGSGSDEGRAMLQLIHDIAPGAELLFHTAFEGTASFAQGIVDLANAGADIIVDDVIYLNEPMFQDGPIAQAIDAVAAQGVAYFSSAGNSGRGGYESAFRGSGSHLTFGNVQAELHDFDPGAGVDVTQAIHVPIGQSFTLSFQWDQPFASVSPASGGSQSDIDILVFDAWGEMVGGGLDDNLDGDPLELFSYTNTSASSTLHLSITNFAGVDPGLMRYVGFNSFVAGEYGGDGTVFGHAAAAGAQAVGAAWYGETPAYGVSPPKIESFSSAGTSTILFDTAGNRLATPDRRATPDITAPDGTNTTFFGRDTDGDGRPNFYGTSAAAPHAAAVAALMLQLQPSLTVTQIYDILQATAIDMDDPATAGFDIGWDAGTGYGLIQADAALAALGGSGGGGSGPSTPTGLYVGDAQANLLAGGSGNDTIMGLDGADTLSGGGGSDSVDGGNAGDLLHGDAGADSMDGGGGNDTVWGDADSDRLEGGEDDDFVAGMTDADQIWGNAGADSLYGNGDNDTVYGGPGEDLLHGGTGSDLLHGGAGADLIYGLWTPEAFAAQGANAATAAGALPDTLLGAGGDDTVYGGNGADSIDGGTGADSLFGLWGADSIEGGAGADTLWGDEGVDRIAGGEDDDFVAGMTDADEIWGNDGDDSLYGNGEDDSLYGGMGNDLLHGGTGSDLVHGGAGADLIYGLWTLEAFAALGANAPSAAGALPDTLLGAGGNDVIYGGNGADSVDGGAGDDELIGLWGDDTLAGGDGQDSIYGNSGGDSLSAGIGDDYVHGGWGDDSIHGGAGADRLEGRWGADEIHGGDGADLLTGNDDDDLLYGDDGDDWLSGGAGFDCLEGGAGDDTLVAVWDSDVLAGGSGADMFVARDSSFGSHRIADFNLAEGDSIDARGVADGAYAVMGAQWVEVRDGAGGTIFTLEGLTDPTGIGFVI